MKKTINKKILKPKVTKNLSLVTFGKGLPKKVMVTHKYTHLTTGAFSFGVPVSYRWRANGMFDPYTGGGSDKPLYFNQLGAIYNHYTVIGAKCTITAVHNGDVSGVPVLFGMFINDDTSVTTNTLKGYTEQSQGRYKMVTLESGPKQVSMKWSAKKFFGGSVLSNTSLQGGAASDPTEQSYFNLFFGPMDEASSGNMVFQIAIEYIAVWKELKDIAVSL